MGKSLAEILAAKKAAASLTLSSVPAITETTESTNEVKPVSMLESIVAKANEEKNKTLDSIQSVSGTIIQSTRIIPDADDLIPRIEALEHLMDENLEDEMKILKEALLVNPQAQMLMLPKHIGMMVTALRRIVGETIAAASEKKPKKTKNLSKEQMEELFNEL